jgi:invasion protein IalB
LVANGKKKGIIAMDHRIASTRPLLGRALTVAGTLAALLLAAPVLAQQPQQKAPVAPAQKAAPAQKQTPAAQPAQPVQPAQQGQPGQPGQQQAGGDQPQLMYSPWMKVCGKGPDTQNKQVCVITKDGRLENGMPVAIVQLFEPEGGQKVLRVTVPLGMQLSHGTRMLIDQGQPMQSPYSICFPVGCMADYQVTDDLIGKMKKGQNIIVQAINMQGTPISLPLPLNDFAKAYDGPPTDPKAFEEQQRKLQEELQKKADEARKKLEGQQSQAPAGAVPAAPPPAQQK